MYECVPLNQMDGRKFPYYNSFVGCHQAYEVFPHHIVSVDGQITKDEAQTIYDQIDKSKRMSNATKAKILESLKTAFGL